MALNRFYFTIALPFLLMNCVAGQNKHALKVQQCYKKDKTKFDGCLLQFWKDTSPLLKTGVPELNLPRVDPLHIEIIDFKEKSSLVNVDAKFSNITVIGASNLVPTQIKVDTKARVVTLNLKFPYLNCTGTYTIKGTIMLLPVEGTGPFSLNMTSIDAVAKMHIVQKGTGTRISKMEIDFNLKGLFLDVEGIMGGDTVGTAIKTMIKENSHDILLDIKPTINRKLEEGILEITADSFAGFPPEAFIS